MHSVRLYFGEVEHAVELTLKCKHRICFVTAPWGQHAQLVSCSSNDKNHGPRRHFWQWKYNFTSSTNRIIWPDNHKQYIFVLRTWAPHTHNTHTHTQSTRTNGAGQTGTPRSQTNLVYLTTHYFQHRHLGMRDSADRQKHWLTETDNDIKTIHMQKQKFCQKYQSEMLTLLNVQHMNDSLFFIKYRNN